MDSFGEMCEMFDILTIVHRFKMTSQKVHLCNRNKLMLPQLVRMSDVTFSATPFCLFFHFVVEDFCQGALLDPAENLVSRYFDVK